MLAMKGADGVVRASLGGVARRARKTPDETQKAIDKFLAPDPDSKNQDNQGRRIERVGGGWQVLNHDFYRNMFSQEEHREYERNRKADYRSRVRDCPGQSAIVPNVPQSDQIRSDQKEGERTPDSLRSGKSNGVKHRWQIKKDRAGLVEDRKRLRINSGQYHDSQGWHGAALTENQKLEFDRINVLIKQCDNELKTAPL